MSYIELVIKIREINKHQIINNFSFDAIFRLISYYITPIFIYLKLTPNAITYISALSGFVGSIILLYFGYSYVFYAVLLFFIHIIIDYCDGNTARYYNISTFYGRFIDGLFNILVLSSLQISMVVVLIYEVSDINSYILEYISKEQVILISLISLVLYPVQHLIYDRYSAYIRWINQDGQTKISPSIKSLISFKIIHNLDNIHYLTLLMMVYHIDFIFANMLINLVLSIILIFLHIYYSYVYMQVDANKNHRVKKEDGND